MHKQTRQDEQLISFELSQAFHLKKKENPLQKGICPLSTCRIEWDDEIQNKLVRAQLQMRFSRAVGICMNDYKQITALNVNNSACIESAARIKTHKCALSLPFLSSSRMGFCILLHVFICYVHSYRGIQQNAVHKFNIALCQYKLSMNESQKHKHLFSHLKYYQCTMKSAK